LGKQVKSEQKNVKQIINFEFLWIWINREFK
jgi:hypothetical protein